MPAPLPPDEAERLKVLRAYKIIDTPSEAAFERLTSLAARLFDVPVAFVTLLDKDRLWFKACYGVDLKGVEEIDRDLSFCSYTILSDEVMVVTDASRDPRFWKNPTITGPAHVRFYAGAPLRTPEGQNLGSLCVIDTVARQFTEEQRAMLADLAAIVVNEMELRLAADDIRAREVFSQQALRETSQLAVAVANITGGVVITDPHQPDNPIVFANPGFYKMTGYSAEEIIGFNCRFLQGPETSPAAVDAIRQATKERRPCNEVLVNYRKDGTTFLNQLSINPVFDEQGELLSFVGLQMDVTERERARQLLEERVQERTAELDNSQIEILSRLARAAEFRDDDTGQHTQRVARTAALIAEAMGLPQEHVEHVRQAAPLHDVGKIAISDLILLKPDKLTDEEFAIMKTHAATGAALLSDGHSEVVQMAERIAGSHHERFDGRGYPNKLAGDEIPLEGRLLAVADVFDALTHERPYKKAWAVNDAVEEIRNQSGRQFDPKVVKAFLTLRHEDLV